MAEQEVHFYYQIITVTQQQSIQKYL